MFRRIFGIGKRKDSPKNTPSTSGGSVGLQDPPLTSGESATTSVVPLHGSQAPVRKKKEPAEVFNEAVEKLVDKLEGINENLNQQVQQNQQLVQRMDVLPDMLSTMPKAVEEQRQAFAQVAEQLSQKVERDAKVAEELCGIHEKVAASTEMQAQMGDNFGKFSDTLGSLDQNTVSQTEWLQQISSTFLASEQYLKHTLSKQQTRFYWILGISLGVCFLAVVGLIIGIVLLLNG
jgi:chromosome segregation ATPase